MLKITGIKKIALTSALPLNLELRITAISKLNIRIVGISVIIPRRALVKLSVNVTSPYPTAGVEKTPTAQYISLRILTLPMCLN